MGKKAFVCAAVLAASPPAVAGRFEKTLPVKPGETVRIEVAWADLSIVEGPAGSVRLSVEVDGTIGEDMLVEAREEVGGPVLKVRPPKRFGFIWKGGVKTRIQVSTAGEHGLKLEVAGGQAKVGVPIRGDVDLEVAGGSLRMADVAGSLRAEVAGGSGAIGSVGGDARVEAAGGKLTVGDVGGDLEAEAAGGGVEVGAVKGDARAKAAGGSVRVGPVGGRFDVRSHGGHATVDVAPGNSAGGTVAAAGGQVRLLVDPAAALDLDLAASGGAVAVDLPGDAPGQAHRGRFSARRNGGGPLIRARSAAGGVTLQARGAERE